MKILLALFAPLGLLMLPGSPQERAAGGPEFVAVDVFVDAGARGLAAWQVEIVADAGMTKVVGVEGGDGPYAPNPPYYDPEALHADGGGRVIVAAYTLAERAPTGRVRVARIHFMEEAPAHYGAKLLAAAEPGGDRIGAAVEVVKLGGKK